MLMELPKDPIVNVHTTKDRGFTPEEVASRCVEKIVEVEKEIEKIVEIEKSIEVEKIVEKIVEVEVEKY